MSKKIDGVKPPVGTASAAVDAANQSVAADRAASVQGAAASAGVSGVSGVQGGARAQGASRRTTRLLTADERAQLVHLIREEAEKMFAGSSAAPAKRQAIEGAVRMTIDSLTTEEDEK